MIQKIKTNNPTIISAKQPQYQPQFEGNIVEGAIKQLEKCEKHPMLNVTVLDVATAIAPRTAIESATNLFAGFEALRRESSGLIVNCLIPGFIVKGFSHVAAKPIFGRETRMASCWANTDTINTVAHYWEKANGKTNEEKVINTLKNILNDARGVDGRVVNGKSNEVLFHKHNFANSLETYKEAILGSKTKEEITAAFDEIIAKTHAGKDINIISTEKGVETKHFSGSLESLLRDTPEILKEFIEHPTEKVSDIVQKSKNLVQIKSLLGLGAIIPLAISMQSINRWVTAKVSGKKGAPIYKDFKDSKTKELTPKEKNELLRQKFISVGSMVGVALLSMLMEKPSWGKIKGIAQFNGLFPTMDQARLISTATFASRMAAAEDKNELKEATVRDIATFSAFYFLGDYVAKGLATVIEKTKKVSLINDLKAPKENMNIVGKFWHWAKDTSLKSTAELTHNPKLKQYRSLCQLGNIGFSIIALGILIPTYTRGKTDKKHREEMEKQGINKSEIEKYYPHFMMNNQVRKQGNVYRAFFTSK